jgi:Fur family transcriptional regulator, peroxide stress response regulator
LAEKRYTCENFREMLKKCSLKVTIQRIAILEALYTSALHPSAENIFETVNIGYPGISLGTVYKTLDSLVQAGLAVKVPTAEGSFRYDWNTAYHNHIYCVNTSEIIDFEDQELKQILDDYFRKKRLENVRLKDIRLQINVEKLDVSKGIQIK